MDTEREGGVKARAARARQGPVDAQPRELRESDRDGRMMDA